MVREKLYKVVCIVLVAVLMLPLAAVAQKSEEPLVEETQPEADEKLEKAPEPEALPPGGGSSSFSPGGGGSSGASASGTMMGILSTQVNVEPSTGAANLSIPIEVPTGRAGIQPNLALTYNSNTRNGVFGVGWSLELGSIQRSNKNGVPTYNNSLDKFVLTQSGSTQELVYDAASQTYKPEIEGAFMKIEYGWTITDKKGTRYIFGSTAQSQEHDPLSPGDIYRWALDKVVDIYGNEMRITYFKEGYKVYPSEITYTYNASQSLDWHAKVVFERESRPDALVNYAAGYSSQRAIKTNYRINEIKTYVGTDLQKRYRLNYVLSPATQRSMISSVDQFGSDNVTQLPAVTFSYQSDKGFTQASGWTIPAGTAFAQDWNGSDMERGVRVIDINSDNYPDLVRNFANSFGSLTQEVYLHNKNNAWVLEPGNGWNLNGVDAVIQVDTVTYAFPVELDKSTRYVDVNADGWLDAVKHLASFGGAIQKKSWLNDHTSSFADTPSWSLPGISTPPGGSDPVISQWQSTAPPSSEFMGTVFADVNADGYVDYVRSKNSANPARAIYLNNIPQSSTGWAYTSSWNLPSGSHETYTDLSNGAILVDLNADGLPDIFYRKAGTSRVYMNHGHGWVRDAISGGDGWELLPNIGDFTDSSTELADINGDGLIDLVVAKLDFASGSRVLINTGSGWYQDDTWVIVGPNFLPKSTRTLDANADGMMDYLVHYQGSGSGPQLFLNTGKPADLLWQVNNGIGGETTLTYESSAYSPNTQYPNKIMPFIIPVVKTVAVKDLLSGQTFTTQYAYKDGVWDTDKREFRGFRVARVTDADGNYSETTFLQDDIFKGRPAKQETYGASGNLFAKVENTWASEQIIAGVNFVYLSRVDNFVYDGNASGKRSAQEFFYDETPELGNLTKAVQLGEVDLLTGADTGTDSRTTETLYVNNTSGSYYIVGLPYQTVAKAHDLSEMRKTWFWYDNHTSLTAAPTQGALTKKEDWNNNPQGHVDNPVTSYSYDALGNLLTTTDPRNNTSTILYDAGSKIFPLAVTNALNQTVINEYYGVNGISLNDGNGLRGLWGQVKSSTDPNNQTARKTYDVFGRMTAVIGPLDSIAYPTTAIEYAFNTNYSTVISRSRIEHGQSATMDAIQFTDGLGRAIQSKARGEASGQYVVSGQTEYNSRGLAIKQYLPFFSTAAFTTIVAIDPNKPHTTISYDVVGRAVQTTNPDGSYASAVFDDWTLEQINENGHKQKSIFDAYGRLVRKEEFTGADGRGAPEYPAAAYTLYAATLYSYDSEGNLKQTTDAHNNITTISYDKLGRKTSMNDPDMGIWSYEYDLNGNLKEQIDAKLQQVNFTYDVLNRLTNKTDAGPLNVNYTYDDVLVNYSKGRLTKAQYVGAQNTQFVYDQLGRETQSTKRVGAVDYQVERAYDALNRLKELEYPDGIRLYYKYNAAGQIEAIADDPALLPGGGASLNKEMKDSDVILVKGPAQQGFVPKLTSGFKERLAHVNFASLDMGRVLSGWMHGFKIWWRESFVSWIKLNIFGVSDAFASGSNWTVNVEAENMPTKTTGGADTYGWNIWGNGYIEQSVTFPDTGEYTFEVIAKGSYAGGAWPNMELRINQTAVANWSVNSTSWKPYIVKINVASGARNVAIAFTNDYYGGSSSTDRNLYVDKTIISKPALGAYQQPNDATGIVSMEMENNDATYTVGGQSWNSISQSGQSGSASMQSLPNSGNNFNTDYINLSTRADFVINFTKTGTHYVWARGIGPSGNDDSFHAGLNGQVISSADRISSFGTSWTWSKTTLDSSAPATINVTATGEHTLNVWMREDGMILDKIVVTTDANYTPTGTGPAETARAGNNPPQAPTLNAPVAGDSQVSLNWTSVTGADGYKVRYGTTSGTYTTTLDVGNVTNHTVTNLTNNTTYYFVAAAYNAYGDSVNSNERSATPVPSIPQAPVLNVPTPGDQQVELSWNAVSGATSYKIYYGTTSGGGGGGTNWTQDADCVGAWKLDETTGAYVDACLANDGTVSGTLTRGVAGQFDEAVEFLGYSGGNNAYVNLGSHSSLDNLTARTVTAWIRPDSLGDGSRGTILSKNYQDGWEFRLAANNNLAFSQAFSGGVHTWTTTNNAVAMGTWQHVAVTYAGNGTSAVPIIYINGVAQPITGGTPFGTPDSDASYNLEMGYANTTYEFDGRIDEAAVFKRILTGTEINAIKDEGLEGGAGSGYPNSIVVGNVTNYTVTNLTNDTAYYFVVTASNSAGESPYSNERSATPTAQAYEGTLYVADVDYNAQGQITHIEYGNGTVTDHTYDPLNFRLTRMQTYKASPYQLLQDFQYYYDKAGNIIGIQDNVNTADQVFVYDALNRLVSATGNYCNGSPCTRNYVYDEVGNILQKDGLTYTYGENGAGPHAVTSLSDGTVFDYDDNGNMISRTKSGQVTEYFYDVENRLERVAKNSVTLAEYAYDGDGGRTKKTVYQGGNTTATTFVGNVYEEAVVNGGLPARTTNFIFLGGIRVASFSVLSGSGTPQIMFYHGDHLGGTNVLTDEAGAMKELIEYEPFGTESRHDKYGSSEEVAWYYFTGKPLDDETGLYYYGARYYDPGLGRFLTADTIVPYVNNPQALNRYSYAGNNPVSHLEDGNGWFIPFIIAAVKGAAIGATIGAATAAITGGNIGQGAMFGAIGGAAFAGLSSAFTSLAKGALFGTTNVSLIGNAATTLNVISGAIGGAAAGAAVGSFSGEAGLGALSGLAGGVAGFAGSYYLAPSAGYVLGNVASAAVTREDLDKAAIRGFIDASAATTIQLMIPEPKIGEQGTPEGGDLIFYRGGGLTDPVGLFLSYLQGHPVGHNAIAVSDTYQVDSHVKGGSDIRRIDFKRQGRLVKWAGTGNKNFVDLAVQYGKTNAFKYWLGPGREVCSTFCGRVAAETGLSLQGFSPASQYLNIQGLQHDTYGVWKQ